jgi:molybdopterin biosynthesis enzyme
MANPTSNQSSGVLTSMIRGDGLAVFAAESETLEAGSEIDVQVLNSNFFEQNERGF